MSSRNPYAPPTAHVADVPATAAYAPGVATERPVFFPVSILKLVLLSLCSFGLYELYWYYKNWQYVREHEGLDIRPFWRAFFSIFYCYPLFRKVRDYDLPSLPLSSLPAGLMATGWIILTCLWRLPDPYWLVSDLAFVFLIPVQRRANEINATLAPGHDRNDRFTLGNWIWLVLGGGLLILVLIGTFALDEEVGVGIAGGAG